MKHAYLIMAHQYPTQLKELVNQLQDGETYFFIHIDKKVDLGLFQDQKYSVPENIFFCTDRVTVNWGGFSQVQATLLLLQELVNKKIQCDYVHLLSGQDFPIKSNEYIKEFFAKGGIKNYINFFPFPCPHWNYGGFDRILYKWMIDEIGFKNAESKVITQIKKKEFISFPTGYSPYGGSQWWSLTYECVEYLAFTCKPSHILYKFYKTTRIPDEMFFQTVLMHSKFKNTVVNNNLRYIIWKEGARSPQYIRMENWEELENSEHLFARKFNDFKNYRVKQELKLKLGFR